MTKLPIAALTVPFIVALSVALPSTASADDLSGADTAWVLTSTALVLFMTIPGLALFYGGLVRTKNILSVLMHCFALTALMSVLWLVCGYSLAFSTAGMEPGSGNLHAFIGSFDKSFLLGVTHETMSGSIPEVLFFAFQMTFAVITPALIVGAFAERMKFSAMLVFCVLWLLVVYVPITHMTWAGDGGYFADRGVIDFAGGIVVHITAGFAALVAAVMIGPRNGYPSKLMAPHNLTMTVTGTGMLWVGWFGFNGGSALAANGDAAMAITVTHISASVGALVWMAIEWFKNGKPNVLGLVTGAVAGLAAITPASGSVGPLGAVAIGAVSAAICWWASIKLKARLGYDDSLDVFGVHGVGGLTGTLMVAFFASQSLGGKEANHAMGAQFGVQVLAAGVTIVWTVIATYAILKLVDATVGLRVDAESEEIGLDLSLHEEKGYNL